MIPTSHACFSRPLWRLLECSDLDPESAFRETRFDPEGMDRPLDWIGFGCPVLNSGDPVEQLKQVKYMSASIRARLLDKAETERQDFNRILTRYSLERILYRLGQSEHAGHFLVKGALLFDLWFDMPLWLLDLSSAARRGLHAAKFLILR